MVQTANPKDTFFLNKTKFRSTRGKATHDFFRFSFQPAIKGFMLRQFNLYIGIKKWNSSRAEFVFEERGVNGLAGSLWNVRHRYKRQAVDWTKALRS